MSAFENLPRLSPFLWFDSNAEEAVAYYLSIFKGSRILSEMRTPDDSVLPKGSVLVINFELDGQAFTAMNGGPGHPFTDAISIVVRCDSQQEVDNYWDKLSAGGSGIACGWSKDKFGLCWQIVPSQMGELLKYPKAFQAMMSMVKLDIAELERAAKS